MSDLSVSVVVYRSDPVVLSRGMKSLAAALAVREARRINAGQADGPVPFTLIDNAALSEADAVALSLDPPDQRYLTIRVLAGHGNVGYGAGHNLAIESTHSRYHLVLNPDVDLAPEALDLALNFLDRHPDVVALSPRIHGGDGRLQYLCRRYPSLADLFIRGFLPARWRRYFSRRLARYEMRDELDSLERPGAVTADTALYPDIISGCFMLFRTEALQALKGFDPRYFLYFEDYDLSLRAGEIGKLAYVPSVDIVHYGGGASRKGMRHIRLFVRSAGQFFNRFGWRWL